MVVALLVYFFPTQALSLCTNRLYTWQPEHDFGAVAAGTPVAHTFVVRNLSLKPLRILRVGGD